MTGEGERRRSRSRGSETAIPIDPRCRVEFESEALAQPCRDRFEDGARVDIDSVVTNDDGTTFQYWTTGDVDPETLIETVTTYPTTLDARLVSTLDGTHRIEVHGDSGSVFAVFGAFGGVPKYAVYDGTRLRFVGEFPVDVDEEALLGAVRDVAPDVDRLSSWTVETSSAFWYRVAEQLTQRQLAALQAAYFGGYYDQPRRTTGEELAEKLGISRQAFHEHLRKACSTVFGELLEGTVDLSEID